MLNDDDGLLIPSVFAGSTGLPSGTPIVAGAGALLLIVVALLASGGLSPPPVAPPQ